MKQLLISFCCVVLMQTVTVAQTSWKSSDYKPEPYRKVMVLAKVTDVTKAGIASREAFLVIADSLQVDALLVYSVNGAEKSAAYTPTVSVGMGVGMYGGYMGASVPIAGGTKMVVTVKMSAYFYNRASTDEQWALQLSGQLDGGTDKLA